MMTTIASSDSSVDVTIATWRYLTKSKFGVRVSHCIRGHRNGFTAPERIAKGRRLLLFFVAGELLRRRLDGFVGLAGGVHGLTEAFHGAPKVAAHLFQSLGAKDQRHDHQDDQQLRNAHRQTHKLSPFDGCSVDVETTFCRPRSRKATSDGAASAVASSMGHIDYLGCGSVHEPGANDACAACAFGPEGAPPLVST